MEEIFFIILCLSLIIVLKLVFNANIKNLKKLGKNDRLDNAVEKYGSDQEICKDILKILNVENVKIHVDLESDSTFYMAVPNDGFIVLPDSAFVNSKKTFARIQTMAHECIHSSQDRRLQVFNNIFSNIYNIYYLISIILLIIKKTVDNMVVINIFLILSLVYYTIRIYLENDAMLRAKEISKKYMESKNISSYEEIQEIIEEYEKINKEAVKYLNYSFLANILIKVIIFEIISLIF